MNSRSLQTTIIFLVVGGILALALGGFFGSASRQFSSVLIEVQTWISSRFLGAQDFLTAPRDIVSLRTRNAELETQVSQLQTQVIELQQRVSQTDILAAPWISPAQTLKVNTKLRQSSAVTRVRFYITSSLTVARMTIFDAVCLW